MTKPNDPSPDYPFTVRPLAPDKGGGWQVEYPDLPGCMSNGETVADAIAHGDEAREAWMAAAREAGRKVPKPGSNLTAGYSVKRQRHSMIDPSLGYPPDPPPLEHDSTVPGTYPFAAREAANVIAIGLETQSLHDAFIPLARLVLTYAQGEQSEPKRNEVIQILERMAESANTLGDSMRSRLAVAYLCRYGPLQVRSIDRLADLADIEVRAREAIGELTGKGRHRTPAREMLGLASPPIKAQVLLALGVRVGWHLVNGRYPGDTNEQALLACDSLWRGLGLQQIPTVGDIPSGWRDHLRAARKLSEGRHDEVRTLMGLGKE